MRGVQHYCIVNAWTLPEQSPVFKGYRIRNVFVYFVTKDNNFWTLIYKYNIVYITATSTILHFSILQQLVFLNIYISIFHIYIYFQISWDSEANASESQENWKYRFPVADAFKWCMNTCQAWVSLIWRVIELTRR